MDLEPYTIYFLGRKIDLQIGNILEFNAEVIVNPTDAELTMVGGLSEKVWEHIESDYEGTTKEEKIEDLKSKLGQELKVTEVFDTKAGSLNARYIFHTILPPIHTKRDLSVIAAQIYITTGNILTKVKEKNVRSIALPPLIADHEEHFIQALEDFLRKELIEVDIFLVLPDKDLFENYKTELKLLLLKGVVEESRKKSVSMNKIVSELKLSSVSDIADLVMERPIVKQRLTFDWDKRQIRKVK